MIVGCGEQQAAASGRDRLRPRVVVVGRRRPPQAIDPLFCLGEPACQQKRFNRIGQVRDDAHLDQLRNEPVEVHKHLCGRRIARGQQGKPFHPPVQCERPVILGEALLLPMAGLAACTIAVASACGQESEDVSRCCGTRRSSDLERCGARVGRADVPRSIAPAASAARPCGNPRSPDLPLNRSGPRLH